MMYIYTRVYIGKKKHGCTLSLSTRVQKCHLDPAAPAAASFYIYIRITIYRETLGHRQRRKNSLPLASSLIQSSFPPFASCSSILGKYYHPTIQLISFPSEISIFIIPGNEAGKIPASLGVEGKIIDPRFTNLRDNSNDIKELGYTQQSCRVKSTGKFEIFEFHKILSAYSSVLNF